MNGFCLYFSLPLFLWLFVVAAKQKTLSPSKFALSGDKKYLLLTQNVRKLYRHTFLAQYTLFDIHTRWVTCWCMLNAILFRLRIVSRVSTTHFGRIDGRVVCARKIIYLSDDDDEWIDGPSCCSNQFRWMSSWSVNFAASKHRVPDTCVCCHSSVHLLFVNQTIDI